MNKYHILVKIMGGLGNQIYQYCAAKAISLSHNAEIYYDLSWYNNGRRKFKLSEYDIPISIKNLDDSYYIITDPIFANDIPLNRTNIYLNGYFQDFSYFQKYETVIKSIFNRHVDSYNIEENSISLHVRRGDYITDYSDIYYNLSLDYYTKALSSYFPKNYHVYIFSDDIEWVKNNFNALSNPTHFVNTQNDILDLQLLSQCHHHIIANSSFSRLGAWLSLYKDKIIIAPANIFKDSKKNVVINNYYPLTWTVI